MEICIQTADVVDVLGFEKGYEAIRSAGFTAIDWNLDHAWKYAQLRDGNYRGKCIMEQPLDKVIEYYDEELSVIRKNGLKISQAHAPFPAYFPGRPDVLEYAVDVYKRNIEYCDHAECGYLIIHGISHEASDRENTPKDIDDLNMKLYESLIPVLLKCKVTVCLENLFIGGRGICEGICADPYQAVRYIDSLNEKAGKEVFAFCLDIGHLNILKKDLRTYIPILGKRIKTLHIHDNDGRNDLHMAPLTGTVDWNEFCMQLNQIGYDGDLDFETFNQTNIAMRTDKELLTPWIELICRTGEVFRRKIQGQ